MLTEEQIDAMPAGEELDRFVAIALGCNPVSRGWQGKGCYECTCPHERHARILPHGYAGCGGHNEEPPSLFCYSSSFDFAMKAAKSVGLVCRIDSDELSSKAATSGIVLYTLGDIWIIRDRIDGHRISEATSGPLAICRAILKTVTPE